MVKRGVAPASYIDFDWSKVPDAKFVHGEAVEIGESAVKVVSKSSGASETIGFDYLVVALGSSYAGALKSPASTQAASVATYAKVVDAVDAARSVVVVGGGASGVELAGEVKTLHPGKTVTVLHSGPHLLSSRDGAGGPDATPLRGLGEDLKACLERKGVRVVLDQRVARARPASVRELTEGVEVGEREIDLGGGERITADLVLWAAGIKPNSAPLAAKFPDRVDERGFVKVDANLRVEGFRHIFALGDVSNAPGPKAVYVLRDQAPVLARNLLRTIHADTTGEADAGDLESYAAGSPLAVVTVGHDDGAGLLFGFSVGGWVASSIKGSDLFLGRQWGMLGASPIPADKEAAIALAKP
jgi:NADH dehydrogenase FAD-containing subunit